MDAGVYEYWAHPRVCGENGVGHVGDNADRGSSPRVRGKPPARAPASLNCGLIPACAGKTPPAGDSPHKRGAHPRVCGENLGATHRNGKMTGSSPRVRGKRGAARGVVAGGGLIPACAGKTTTQRKANSLPTAHPRVCGENPGGVAQAPRGWGSSPRVRGKQRPKTNRLQNIGLIPACAGKTLRVTARVYSSSAHPRVCGENTREARKLVKSSGSSPRVRGKHDTKARSLRRVRLIPACAGKTLIPRWPSWIRSAHPRVCGENAEVLETALMIAGSSPRVRGKHGTEDQVHTRQGLIPACAGKTSSGTYSREAWPAHPRVCGENSPAHRLPWLQRGSSPRVRGKHSLRDEMSRQGGLIPACAGKTRQRLWCGPASPAHPRVCGENMRSCVLRLRASGSSPRVRGKHEISRKSILVCGLIPACAGKTPRRLRIDVWRGAHPRVCGENHRSTPIQSAGAGSSPRVRGKRSSWRKYARDFGLIPACAGKTSHGSSPAKKERAHPRVCGENGTIDAFADSPTGSSPRVRGKLF